MDDFIFNNFQNVSSVIGANASALIQNDIMYGSLIEVDRISGYWLTFDSDENTTELTGYKTPKDIEYSLIEGNNLVSFPSDTTEYALESVLPDTLVGVVNYIIGENKSAMYDIDENTWYGSLQTLSGFSSYWMRSTLDIDFTYNFNGDFTESVKKKCRTNDIIKIMINRFLFIEIDCYV